MRERSEVVETKEKLTKKNKCMHNWYTYGRRPVQCQRGTRQSWGTWAWRGRNAGEGGCTSHHCRRAVRSWADRSWWRLSGWRGCQRGSRTTRPGWRTWSQSMHHSWSRRWTMRCWVRPSPHRILGCTDSHTHKHLLHFTVLLLFFFKSFIVK